MNNHDFSIRSFIDSLNKTGLSIWTHFKLLKTGGRILHKNGHAPLILTIFSEKWPYFLGFSHITCENGHTYYILAVLSIKMAILVEF